MQCARTKNDIPLLLDFNGDGYDDMAICSVNDEEVSVNRGSGYQTREQRIQQKRRIFR